MSAEHSGTVSYDCECGKRLKVPASAAGRRAKCPRCQAIFTVPSPQDEATDVEAMDDGLSLLDELARQEQTAAPARPTVKQPPASSATGFASAGGGPRGFEMPATEKVSLWERVAGTTLLGSVFSGLGAAIGAALWVVIAIKFDREIGFVAWGLGGLAGLGMLLGRGEPSSLGGLLAAGNAFAGIVAAKLAIFAYVLTVLITGQTDVSSLQKVLATIEVAQEILDERGVTDENEREEAWEETLAEASEQVKYMDDDQVERKWQQYQQRQGVATVDAAPADERRDRLAWHYAKLEAMDQGLPPWDTQRDMLYEGQLAAYQDLSDDELGAEIAQLEAWLETGRWSDRQYIRARLIYDRLDMLLDISIKVPDTKWRDLYDEIAKDVDTVPFAEQVEAVRDLEAPDDNIADSQDTEFAEDAQDEDESNLVGFFAAMFGFYDLIFVVLAVGTAYRVAAGGSGD